MSGVQENFYPEIKTHCTSEDTHRRGKLMNSINWEILSEFVLENNQIIHIRHLMEYQYRKISATMFLHRGKFYKC